MKFKVLILIASIVFIIFIIIINWNDNDSLTDRFKPLPEDKVLNTKHDVRPPATLKREDGFLNLDKQKKEMESALKFLLTEFESDRSVPIHSPGFNESTSFKRSNIDIEKIMTLIPQKIKAKSHEIQKALNLTNKQEQQLNSLLHEFATKNVNDMALLIEIIKRKGEIYLIKACLDEDQISPEIRQKIGSIKEYLVLNNKKRDAAFERQLELIIGENQVSKYRKFLSLTHTTNMKQLYSKQLQHFEETIPSLSLKQIEAISKPLNSLTVAEENIHLPDTDFVLSNHFLSMSERIKSLNKQINQVFTTQQKKGHQIYIDKALIYLNLELFKKY